MSSFRVNRAHEIKAKDGETKMFRLSIASINIEIRCPYGSHFSEFRNYRAQFENPDIVINITQKDIDLERKNHPEISDPDFMVDCEKVAVTYDYGCFEPNVALQKFADAIIPFNSFLMHGAVVAVDDYAYMFTASSGVGKTTRTNLWLEEYPASIIVNGDKPVIKVTDQKILVCGTPWCGKEYCNTNTIIPLRAVFLLERADVSKIEEISMRRAFPILLQHIHRPVEPDLMEKTLDLLQSIDGKVKIFRFCSPPTADAVRLAYETAKP